MRKWAIEGPISNPPTAHTPSRQPLTTYNFEVRHPRCVSNKSNVMCIQYVVKHNLMLDVMVIY